MSPNRRKESRTSEYRGVVEVRENEVIGKRVMVWPRVAKFTFLLLAELF